MAELEELEKSAANAGLWIWAQAKPWLWRAALVFVLLLMAAVAIETAIIISSIRTANLMKLEAKAHNAELVKLNDENLILKRDNERLASVAVKAEKIYLTAESNYAQKTNLFSGANDWRELLGRYRQATD